MTTSQTQLKDALSKPVVPPFWLGYFQEGFRRDIHEKLTNAFELLSGGFGKGDIAKRMGRKPEQITRWLAGPSNLESDTISDLALAMGYTAHLVLEPLRDGYALKPNQVHAVTEIIQNDGYVIVTPLSSSSSG